MLLILPILKTIGKFINNSGNLCQFFFYETYSKVHGNFHVPFTTHHKARYMEISMYLEVCFVARYMEISMCLAMKHMARYMEISMYLEVCFVARYMEISMYLEMKHMARYMEISTYLATKHMARYMEISMYLSQHIIRQGTWKFSCALR